MACELIRVFLGSSKRPKEIVNKKWKALTQKHQVEKQQVRKSWQACNLPPVVEKLFPRWTGLFCFVPSHCAAYGLFLLWEEKCCNSGLEWSPVTHIPWLKTYIVVNLWLLGSSGHETLRPWATLCRELPKSWFLQSGLSQTMSLPNSDWILC